MRMTKRREQWLLWLAGIVVCLMLSVGAAVSAQAAGRQVYDDAGLFSDSEISELTAAVNVAEEETGWDLMLLTVNDSSVGSTQSYAEEKFNEYTEKDNGIAFVLDMNARLFYIATAGEAYEYVGDTRLNELLDDATAYAGDGDYYQAMIAMLNDTVTFYQEGKPDHSSVYDADQGIYRDVSGNNAAAGFEGYPAGNCCRRSGVCGILPVYHRKIPVEIWKIPVQCQRTCDSKTAHK